MKIGTRVYVYVSQHGTYLAGQVVAVRGGTATVVCNGLTYTKPTSQLPTTKPAGYR